MKAVTDSSPALMLPLRDVMCLLMGSPLQCSSNQLTQLFVHRSDIGAASDDTPRQAELPYPMSAWRWDKQETAAAWMVVPTGEAGLGLQVCVLCRPCWFWLLTCGAFSKQCSDMQAPDCILL